jgi:phage shock protein PspC (stress-responsive transcriptional regulator)
MTTTDIFDDQPMPPPDAGQRLLRRNRTNRVAAGVSSGLGDYFGVDPVLFRVLFATAAFFGGAGVLAYLLAWAAIPEAGAANAPIDRWISWLRRRRVPVWLVAVAAGLILWAVAFSWWAPGPFFPVIAVVVLLVFFFGRRELQGRPAEPVSLIKGDAPPTAESTAQPTWPRDARSWFDEARQASRIRRRRAMPIRVAALVTLVVTLTVLGNIDAVSGIQFQVYFWVTLGIVGLALLVGLALRRTPYGISPLLIPAVVGAIAFGGSHASLHDGVGQREWKPTAPPASEYRLAFGQGVLDLTSMPTPTTPRTIDVTVGAGQVKIIAKKSLNLTVLANIHFGEVEVDGDQDHAHGGVGISRTVSPPAHATGVPITVDVHLTNGQLVVDHR